MKGCKYTFLLLALVWILTGCHKIDTDQNIVKNMIPMQDRRYIYQNGLEIKEESLETVDTRDNCKLNISYQSISGLKDKNLQEKINNKLLSDIKQRLSQLEAQLNKKYGEQGFKLDNKGAYSYIPYNCNNVLFIKGDVYIEGDSKEKGQEFLLKSFSWGYDLNTGKAIALRDLFKPEADYKSIINDAICRYIIEKNFDDYDSDRMTGPFLGIPDNQSFSFSKEGLTIILDEKNPEFVSEGYVENVFIPLKELGDNLIVFDRYMYDKNGLYEKEKLTKALLPNPYDFKEEKLVNESTENTYINIVEGKYINMPNMELANKLNKLAACSYDTETVREMLKQDIQKGRQSHFIHNVGVVMNAGGYFSTVITEQLFLKGQIEKQYRIFNYDFNKDKELSLQDLFIEGVNAETLLENCLQKNGDYSVKLQQNSPEKLKGLLESSFYMTENGMYLDCSIEGAGSTAEKPWIWLSFEELGWENIKLFN